MFLSQCSYVIVADPVGMDSLQLDDVTRDTSARSNLPKGIDKVDITVVYRMIYAYIWRHDTQGKDTKYSDTQDTTVKGKINVMTLLVSIRW